MNNSQKQDANKPEIKDLSKMSKDELGEYLAPLSDLARQMILAGTLKKNVIRHFTNKWLPFNAAENLTAVGALKAEIFMTNKAK